MLSLDETLQLNNEGVALFHANELARAADKLHSSLLGARSLIRHSRARGSSGDSSNEPQFLHCCEDSQASCRNKYQNGYFLFMRALAFSEPKEQPQGSTQAHLSVYCAGIVFNLAILHHKHWMKNGSPVNFTDKAVAFYRTAIEIVQSSTGWENNPSLLLVALASHNNLAQIEQDRGMVEEVHCRIHYMVGILYTRKEMLIMTLSKREVEGLLSNILSAGHLKTAAAA